MPKVACRAGARPKTACTWGYSGGLDTEKAWGAQTRFSTGPVCLPRKTQGALPGRAGSLQDAPLMCHSRMFHAEARGLAIRAHRAARPRRECPGGGSRKCSLGSLRPLCAHGARASPGLSGREAGLVAQSMPTCQGGPGPHGHRKVTRSLQREMPTHIPGLLHLPPWGRWTCTCKDSPPRSHGPR